MTEPRTPSPGRDGQSQELEIGSDDDTQGSEPDPDMSRRTPHTRSDLNDADIIEQHMLDSGQKTWGFVIYRTTYRSDKDWAEALRRLRVFLEDHFDSYNGRDVLELLELTTFDDPSQFDGLDTRAIRQHFDEWAKTAPEREQGLSVHGEPFDVSPRYWYALQVDEESLNSIIESAPPPDEDYDDPPWVILIDRFWKAPARLDDSDCVTSSQDGAGSGSESDHDHEDSDGGYEPLDGLTTYEVGWIKVSLWSVMPQEYMILEGQRGMLDNYRRPPAVNQ